MINDAQLRLYRAEWNAARRVLRDLAWSPKKADAERKAIHVRVLGEDVSSLDLTNGQLDKVLAAFRAVARPEQLGPQLDAADQPRRRRRWVIQDLCGKLGYGVDYAEAIAVSMNREGKLGRRDKFELVEMNEAELDKVIVALRKQIEREGRAEGVTAKGAKGSEILWSTKNTKDTKENAPAGGADDAGGRTEEDPF